MSMSRSSARIRMAKPPPRASANTGRNTRARGTCRACRKQRSRPEETMPRLANKVALITGAAGGQGVAEAELFVREGAAVMLTDIDQPGGEALAKRLAEQGGRGRFMVHAAAREGQWSDFVTAALTGFGGLHIRVNNAGAIARQGIVDSSLA